jgi:hypothetical protein
MSMGRVYWVTNEFLVSVICLLSSEPRTLNPEPRTLNLEPDTPKIIDNKG